MEKYSELAFNIVNNLLKIKSDDVISISGEIHNSKNANDPLVELPLIEELSVAIRKRKAFPVLEISTENLKRRFFAEMPDEVFSVPPNYYKSWINSIDKFIEISWESYSSDFRSVSEKQLQQFKDSTKSILQYLFDQKKKLIFLNFPTHELAKYIKSDPSVNIKPCHRTVINLLLLRICSFFLVAFLSIIFFSGGSIPRAMAGSPSVIRFIHRI